MRLKIVFLTSILIFLFGCNQTQEQTNIEKNRALKHTIEFEKLTMIADTITNWQFYKDSELLFKSNIVETKQFTTEIKTSDNYENLILNMFYDFNTEIMTRKVEFVSDKKILATFISKDRSHAPIQIPKTEVDKIISKKIGRDIYINYSDPIQKKGITIGILKFIEK